MNFQENDLSTESTRSLIEKLPEEVRNLELRPGVVAVDFESFYDNDYSLKELGPWHYCHHELFDPYLVSVVGRTLGGDPVHFVGSPEDAPWALINDCEWLSHNQGFDGVVYDTLREKSPEVFPEHTAAWHCTANLAVFVGGRRDLAGAAAHLLGITVSKDLRDGAMKGMRWSEADEELKEKVRVYALCDSFLCAGLWAKHSDLWPEHERFVSRHGYDMGREGIVLDIEKIEADIRALGMAKFNAEQQIPWRHESKLLSVSAFAAECRKLNIAPPASLAMDNEDTDKWFDQNGHKAPFASAMRTWRRANALQKKLEVIRDRAKADGRVTFSLFYFGSHTGRWSGGGGKANFQNLYKNSQYLTKGGDLLMDGPEHWRISQALKKGLPVEELAHTINVRGLLKAPPGHKFVVCDLAQIEARCLPWLAGDRETIALLDKGRNEYDLVDGKWKLVAEGPSVYEVHARRSMGWKGGKLKSEDALLYALAKARQLALGFGAGYEKFIAMSWIYIEDPGMMEQIFGKPVTDEQIERFVHGRTWWVRDPVKREAWLTQWSQLSERDRRWSVNAAEQVADFRQGNPKISGLWRSLQDLAKSSAQKRESFTLGLPSGRELFYFDPYFSGGEINVRYEMGGNFYKVYGGLLTENITQATARDILAEAVVRLAKAGIKVVLHVHDEVVCEVPQDFDSRIIFELMRVRPEWAKSLPIDAEFVESPVYVK